MLVQPDNRGTGNAIAATTLILSALDPEAIVAFLPCDHHHSSDSAFRDVIEAGMFAAHDRPDKIILVGAEAKYAETEYGWIEPMQTRADAALVPVEIAHFWEQPTLARGEAASSQVPLEHVRGDRTRSHFH